MKLFEKMKINFKKTSKKAPKEKDVMLQTYFTSLLALVLSMAMFFGTTYAWFTSEVNNAGNEIYIGTLSASLHKQLKETVQGEQGAEEKITYQDLADETKGYKLFDGTVRWEPGYTMLETIEIRNEGDLAFKYVLSFTDGTLEDTTANMADIAKYFDVWVYSHQSNQNAPDPTVYRSYSDIIDKDSGWVNAGNLKDLLEGKQVLTGTMTEVRLGKNSTETANEGTTDGAPAAHNFTLALHMNEEATAAVMGHKIGLNVKLVAYQLSAELDAFQNSSYDSNIVAAANEAQLKKILSEGGEMLLLDDVTIAKEEDVLVMKSGRLDGANHTITADIKAADGTAVTTPTDVLTLTGGTIANLTMKGNGNALVLNKLERDLYLNDSTFGGVTSLKLDLTEASEYGVYANGSTFESDVDYDHLIKEANFYLCNFKGVLAAGGNTRLENCTFNTDGLDVTGLASGESITLINCSYNNATIAKAVISKSSQGELTVDNNQLMIDSTVVNGSTIYKVVVKPTP